MFAIHSTEQLLKFVALVSAVMSIAIGIWYIVRRPHLNRVTKSMLLLGLGAFPDVNSLVTAIKAFAATGKLPEEPIAAAQGGGCALM